MFWDHHARKVTPEDFRNKQPFPHVVIDDFLYKPVAEKLRNTFPDPNSKWYQYDNVFEKKYATDNFEHIPEKHQTILMYLNSQKGIQFFEKITGIEGLIPDPWLRGGGLHCIKPGGKLDVHVDFNWHNHLKLHRRLNVLIYLNSGEWREEWGGHLELWSQDKKKCVQRILPRFNRMVCFATTETSYHGHPEPLNCPTHISRQSLALYYYTSTRPEEEIANPHSTKFIARPDDPKDPEIEQLREVRNKGRLSSNV